LIFRDALKSVRASANSAIFIDDVEAYVAAARSLGLHGIQYQNPTQLRADLNEVGANLPI
jgi:FMN phosphatase YigB (HAD superfamily)